MNLIDTVVLGDCEDHLLKLPDAFADLVVTDCPYGIEYKSNRQRLARVGTDKYAKDATIREHYFDEISNDDCVPVNWLEDAYRILKPDTAIYIFCHWSKWGYLFSEVEKVGFKVKNMIVLNKSCHGMGDLQGSYAPKHELLMFACKGRHTLRWPKGRGKDVWDVPVRFSGSKRLHPNEKPLSWILPAIINSSDMGQLVVDPFCGSGTTLVAAKQLGCKYFGIEIDEQYYNTTINRLDDIPTLIV